MKIPGSGRRHSGNALVMLVMLVAVAAAVAYFLQRTRSSRIMSYSSNDRMASACMMTLATSQADFRSNDRDGNIKTDFWVADVQGLYSIQGTDGKPINLIEVTIAQADTVPRLNACGTIYDSPLSFASKSGYVFRCLKRYATKAGPAEYDPDGDGRNLSKFGFIAHPERFGETGKITFILNEINTRYQKEVDGSAIDTFPLDPIAEGWQKVD